MLVINRQKSDYRASTSLLLQKINGFYKMGLTSFIKTLLLPPALQIILLFIGFLIWKLNRRLAYLSLFLGFTSLWLLSTPLFSAYLHQWLEAPFQAHTSSEKPKDIQAIVVLGSGRHRDTLEYGKSSSSVAITLWGVSR